MVVHYCGYPCDMDRINAIAKRHRVKVIEDVSHAQGTRYKGRMAGMASRPAAEAADYFVRQGLDADGLAADLATAAQRRRYIATFYTSRFWAHPGAFMGDAAMVFGPYGGTPTVDFHTEPFGDAEKLRVAALA